MTPYNIKTLSFLILIIILSSISACGYQLQNTQNPLYFQKGIEKIYIQPVKNNTATFGTDNIVLRSMIQELESQKKIKFVRSPEKADAYLLVEINDASYTGINPSSIQSLDSPGIDKTRIPGNIFVASEYVASLNCSFSLIKSENKETIWSTNLTKQKFFPANNRIGPLGSTSALINESEFRRSISDLSTSMMSELTEHLLGMF